MATKSRAVLGAMGVGAALLLSLGLAGVAQADPPAAMPEGTAGMVVYIDPVTGEVLSAPAPGALPLPLSPPEQEALSTSHEGLAEVPSSVPGGGFKLDLKGRFQSPMAGAVDDKGIIKWRHLGEPHKAGHEE